MAYTMEQASRLRQATIWGGGSLLLLLGLALVRVTPSIGAADDKNEPAKTEPAKTEPAKPAKAFVLKPVAKRGVGGLDSGDAEMVKAIDDKLEAAWKANNVQSAELCTDFEFIRRVSLDLLGRIATTEEVVKYLKYPEATRRSQIVKELLSHQDSANNFANLWSNWLLTRSGVFGRGKYHQQMHSWLADQFALNKKYNLMVTELITAKGSNTENDNGKVNFILAHVGDPVPPAQQKELGQFEMVPITSRITRLFLGIQTQCTQCHDHPFDQRKQSEFWGINAFLRQVTRQGNPVPRRQQEPETLTLTDNTTNNVGGTVFFEKRNGVVLETAPAFFDLKKVNATGKDRRVELAKLVIAHENFGKAFVNRMWSHFLARGFCNPVDDFNSQNQVQHPELLQELADKFIHYGYDQRRLITWICNSKAYNLKAVANETNDKPEHEVLFSRMIVKNMSPEQLFESLWTATGDSQNADGKRVAKESWMNKLVANFGDDEGNEVTFNGTVVQALMLMNGAEMNQAITKADGTVAKILKANPTDAGRVNALFLASLNRQPSQNELTKVLTALPLVPARPGVKPSVETKPENKFHDLFWALLNSNEFVLNH